MTDELVTDRQLVVEGLAKHYGDQFSVTGVSLSVGRDEIVSLLGPSGCGKTTVLRCIAGVTTPDDGRIEIGGEIVRDGSISRPPERRHIGMVYQNYAIWPHKTVRENVIFPLEHAVHDIPADRHEERLMAVLEMVEIADEVDTPATDLSGGQQQRTALARSLVHDPDLLLMDEPLSNLDRELRKSMRNEIQRLQHELGFSVLYVTHDQEEAFYLADTVLVMNEGQLIERGEPRELFARPKSPFTRRFIGDRNRFSGRLETDDGSGIVNTAVGAFPLENVDFVADDVVPGPVECFLRPDDIRIGRFAADSESMIQLTGVVVAEGILGDTYELTIEVADAATDLVLQTENYVEYDPGDAIDVHIQPRTIQVYPSADQ